MPLPSSLLFMLVLGSIPICSTHWAPRTLRPNLLGPPPSLIRRGTGQTLAAGTSGIDYNNSSSRYSSGTGTLPIVSIPTNDSSTQQQYTSDTLSTHYSRYEEVCGTRTRNIISYGDEEPNAFFNFPDFCLLWDDTCSGNESFAKRMYSTVIFLLFSRGCLKKMSYICVHCTAFKRLVAVTSTLTLTLFLCRGIFKIRVVRATGSLFWRPFMPMYA